MLRDFYAGLGFVLILFAPAIIGGIIEHYQFRKAEKVSRKIKSAIQDATLRSALKELRDAQ